MAVNSVQSSALCITYIEYYFLCENRTLHLRVIIMNDNIGEKNSPNGENSTDENSTGENGNGENGDGENGNGDSEKLELDKIQISKVEDQYSPTVTSVLPEEKLQGKPEEKLQSKPEEKLQSKPEEEVPKGKHLDKKKLIIIFAGATVILLSIIVFLWSRSSVTSSPKEEVVPPEDLYAKISSVTVVAGKAGKVTLALYVHFNDPKLKEEIVKKDALIKNTLRYFLSSAPAERIISKKEFNVLRLSLKDEINKALGDNYLDNVYFSEIVIR